MLNTTENTSSETQSSKVQSSKTQSSKTRPSEKSAPSMFNWQYIIDIAMEHKQNLITANILGLLAVLAIVPIPLLLPLLVDEVLLNQPATLVNFINTLFPSTWHGPVLYRASYPPNKSMSIIIPYCF